MEESVSKPQPAKKLFFKHILKKIFLEDWALKLLALVITFALWLGVTGLSTPTTKRLTVPLNLNISSNAQVVNVPQQEVEIEISGDKTRIGQINRSELAAFVDLTETQPGDRVVLLSPENVYVALPTGIKLVQVAPSRIAVNLEAVVEKEIEVRPETSGVVATGSEIYNTSVLPSSIRVRGPASIMRLLEYVETDAIDIAGKTEEFTARQVVVNSPDPKAAVLNTVVDVVFKIGEKRVERRFSIPIDGESNKTARFTLYGPKTLMTKLRTDELKVEMYLDGNGEILPRVVFPDEIKERVEIRNLAITP